MNTQRDKPAACSPPTSGGTGIQSSLQCLKAALRVHRPGQLRRGAAVWLRSAPQASHRPCRPNPARRSPPPLTHLGEEARPERLHVHPGRLDERVDLVLLQRQRRSAASPAPAPAPPAPRRCRPCRGSPPSCGGAAGARTHRDGHLVVVQDEGGVDAGELGDGGHGGGAVPVAGVGRP